MKNGLTNSLGTFSRARVNQETWDWMRNTSRINSGNSIV